MSDQSDSKIKGPLGPRRRTKHGFFGGIFVGGLLGVVLAVTVGAYAQFGGQRSAHFRSLEPEMIMERAEFAVEFALGKVDATDAQQAQVKTIIQTAIADLQPILTEHGSDREAVHEIFSQSFVDRVALEQLRTNRLQQADTASERLLHALADAAEVLTQEQRMELIALGKTMRH